MDCQNSRRAILPGINHSRLQESAELKISLCSLTSLD